MTPLDLLQWYNLVYAIPVAFGILAIAGSALGFGDHEGGHDHDFGDGHDGHLEHDHDAGHEHDNGHEQGSGTKILSAIGVGRVPLSILLAMITMIFGGTGLIVNIVLDSLGLSAGIMFIFTCPVALIISLVLSGLMARLVGRFMPTTETYVVKKKQLQGSVGTLITSVDSRFGLLQVRDRFGHLHQVSCRTISDGAELAKGVQVLLAEYNEKEGIYYVSEFRD